MGSIDEAKLARVDHYSTLVHFEIFHDKKKVLSH